MQLAAASDRRVDAVRGPEARQRGRLPRPARRSRRCRGRAAGTGRRRGVLMADVSLQSTSRDSLAQAEEQLDRSAESLSADDLRALGEQLYSVLRVLSAERTLMRYLADATVDEQGRTGLATGCSRTRSAPPRCRSSATWSRRGGHGRRTCSPLWRRSPAGRCSGWPSPGASLDEVEDELFRFGRVLDREPELNTLLTDPNGPVDKRVELLNAVCSTARSAGPPRRCWSRPCGPPRGRALDQAASELAELAAARRNRYIARVRTAFALSAGAGTAAHRDADPDVRTADVAAGRARRGPDRRARGRGGRRAHRRQRRRPPGRGDASSSRS